jgi:hypothetical protein
MGHQQEEVTGLESVHRPVVACKNTYKNKKTIGGGLRGHAAAARQGISTEVGRRACSGRMCGW